MVVVIKFLASVALYLQHVQKGILPELSFRRVAVRNGCASQTKHCSAVS